MKIKLSHLFSEASGKVCKKESAYVSYNKKTGKMYVANYHDREKLTEKEEVVRDKFNARQAFAQKWWKENKEKNTDDYKLVMEMYDAQSRIGNPYSYFLTLITSDLKVRIKGKDAASSGSPAVTPGGDEETM